MADKDSSKENAAETLLKQILLRLDGPNKEGGLDKLAPAYVEAWGAVEHVVKDANNPHFGSDYATLEATMNALRGPFSANKLALLTVPGVMSAAGDRISVNWVLFHASGQRMQGTTELPIGGKSTAQAAGSAITYARRYLALAIAGIAPKDDDGNGASEQTAPAKRGPGRPRKESAPQKVTEPEEDEDDAEEEEPEEKPAKAKDKSKKAKAGSDEYQEQKDALENRVLECETLDELEEMKQEVIDFNDEELGQAYILRRKALKGKKN